MTRAFFDQMSLYGWIIFLIVVFLGGNLLTIALFRRKVTADSWMIALFFLVVGGCGLLMAWYNSLPVR